MKTTLIRLLHTAAHRPACEGLNSAEQATLCTALQSDILARLRSDEAWALLAELLLAPHPGHALLALRAADGLKRWLPELDRLFGVPQLSDEAYPVDVGLHQCRVVEEAARADAPLEVRFAALVHKLGMGGTPPEIWPSHYKHEPRGLQALAGLQQRFALPEPVLDLAALVITEADRVHRANDLRAGAVAGLLARLQALEQPERFEALLSVCTCDWAAYAGHSAASYPKAPRLRRARAAYAAAPVQHLPPDDEAARLQARAEAIAQALRPAGSA